MYHLTAKGREISCSYESTPMFSGILGKNLFAEDIRTAVSRTDMPSGFRGDLTERIVRILNAIEQGENLDVEFRGNMLNVGADIEHF